MAYRYPSVVAGINADWSRWTSNRGLVDQALQRHLLQVGFADRLLGVLLRRLQASGAYGRTLLIVTADHGASFEPNGHWRAVDEENLADIAGIPLFVKYPGQRLGRTDDRGAKTIDIVPTIADVLGVRIPWHVDGLSLRGRTIRRRISVSKVDGDPVFGNTDAVEAGVRATARRNASLFGVGTHSMYRIGPYLRLLGTSPASSGPRRDDVRFDYPVSFFHVQLSSGFVPARVAGAILGDGVPVGTPLAIVVDRHVRAMTRSYQLDGRSRFEALVPETSFQDGQNAVEIYAVSRSRGAFRFRALGGTPAPASAPATAAALSSQSVATLGGP
jgi:hypothetical protein